MEKIFATKLKVEFPCKSTAEILAPQSRTNVRIMQIDPTRTDFIKGVWKL